LKKEDGVNHVTLTASVKRIARKEALGLQELGKDAVMQKCILVMCGLPGAGKTMLTSHLVRQCEGVIPFKNS
jgi:hypothetical protein